MFEKKKEVKVTNILLYIDLTHSFKDFLLASINDIIVLTSSPEVPTFNFGSLKGT